METLTEKEISPYAVPGITETTELFIKRLGLKVPILVPNEKFKLMWHIFEKVCRTYNEDPKEVYYKNTYQGRPVVEIRQISMKLFREELKYSQATCAAFFYLEHCSTIHSIKTINNLRETDKEFREKTDILFKK